MSKIRKLLVCVFAAVCASMLALVACGEGSADGDDNATVELKTHEIVMKVGDEIKLEAVSSRGAKLSWSVDDKRIATVSDDGTVKAVKEGNATVFVTAGKSSDYCAVIVSEGTQEKVDDEIKEDGYIYHEDFDDRTAVPGYLRINKSGGGAIGVADGEMQLTTVGTGIAFATYVFDETLSGKIVAETRVKVSSTSFSNILFFYRGEQGYSTDDVIACLGMNAGTFQNHDGGGWKSIGKSYSTQIWYTVKMELDIGAGRYDLFIDGQKFARIPFRKTGDGVEDRIKLLKFGTDKENAGLYYDYIKVSQGSDESAPVIESSRTVYRLALDTENSVSFDYSVDGNPKPTVTLVGAQDNPEGATVSEDNRTVTFDETANGTYNFGLTATNKIGNAEKRFTVIVSDDDSVILDTDFSSVPPGMTFTANNGDAKVEGGKLILTTNSSGSVLTYASYDFGQPLTGKVRVRMTVTVGTNAFSNILFLYHSGTEGFDPLSCTNSIAVENGMLKYNAGGWKDIERITLGTAFELEVLFDFDNHTVDLWLNGDKKLTGAAFRKSSGDTGVLTIGSDKVNTQITYDSMSFVKEQE